MEFNEFIFRILVCFGLSFLVGIERQYRDRPVGLRTSILVCIGAFLFVSYASLVGIDDNARIAAQVVTGIGFLGAGVILKDGKKVRGLTTAATLWCVAAIGVLCAGGAVKEAAFGTLIILFSNTLLRYINALVHDVSESKKIHNTYELNITSKDNDVVKIKSQILDFLSVNREYIEFVSYETKDILGGIKLKVVININKFKSSLLDELSNEINKKYKILAYKVNKIAEIKEDEDEDEL